MTDDLSDRPEQFKVIEADLHAVRERMHEENQDWVPNVTTERRDMRDPATVGREILRMKRSGRHEDEQAEYTLELEKERQQVDELMSSMQRQLEEDAGSNLFIAADDDE